VRSADINKNDVLTNGEGEYRWVRLICAGWHVGNVFAKYNTPGVEEAKTCHIWTLAEWATGRAHPEIAAEVRQSINPAHDTGDGKGEDR